MNISEAVKSSNGGESLPVCEYFYSLQGEGFHTGRAAFFVRLSGCDVGCPWCDTKNSWSIDSNSFMTISEIVKIVKESTTNCVVITGGEPTLYDLSKLVDALHYHNIEVNLETSGTGFVYEKIDWVTVSPKKNKLPLEENLKKANELKIVVENIQDFELAERYKNMASNSCKFYLQAQWEEKKSLSLIIEYIKTHNKWKLSLQTHKYINIE